MTPQKRQQVAAVQKTKTKKKTEITSCGRSLNSFLKADKSYNASKNEMLLSTAACLKDF